MKQNTRVQRSWAIATGDPERPGFIGYGWFGWRTYPHLAGNTTALFETRAKAREALREVVKRPGEYQAFPKARVVRVTVAIAEAR